MPQSSYELGQSLGNPWAAPFPLVVDMRAAERELVYAPVATYPEAVRETVQWLVRESAARDWRGTYLERFFDYAADDAAITPAST